MGTYLNRRTWAALPSVLALCIFGTAVTARADAPRPVIAYYAGYVGDADVAQVPWQSITQINISFVGINQNNQCAWMDLSGNDQPDPNSKVLQAIDALIAARNANNPNVKLVLSVGGWTMSYRFSDATATSRGAQQLATSCVSMVDALGLDGVDYDWEYPGSLGQKNCPADAVHTNCVDKNDGKNFARLLRYSRSLLNDDNRPLSVAVYANTAAKSMDYDYAEMDKYLSFWNIMSYDVNAPTWSPSTAFNAPISAAQETLAYFASQGATPSKLNLGIPLYGYRFQNITSATVGAAPTASASRKDGAQYSYRDIVQTWGTDDCCSLHEADDGDFYYCPSGRHVGDWIGVDSPRVAKIKAQYVRQHGFGGALFWVIPGDTDDYAVTRAVHDALNNP